MMYPRQRYTKRNGRIRGARKKYVIPRSAKKRILGMSLWKGSEGTSSSLSVLLVKGLFIKLQSRGITRNSSDETLVHPVVTTYAMKNDA